MYLEFLPPVSIAASALFSGVHVGTAHAQEPTPPPENDTGIGLYCDEDASCFITEGTQTDVYPQDTGTVANTAVGFGLIDPGQAGACADAFENVHGQYLTPNPADGRPLFQFPGMQFELPPECTTNLFKEAHVADGPGKPEAPPDTVTPENHEPQKAISSNFWDCLASIGILAGLSGAGHIFINRRHRKKT